jgi:putative inorganic carbon (HCO3(-)) transporter
VPTEHLTAYWQRTKLIEGFVLLTATPFLFFPQRFILITVVFLFLLAALWIAPGFMIGTPLIPPTPFNAALVIFTIFVGIAILVTADRDLTLSKATVIIFGIGIWRFLILAVQNRSQVKKAIAAYLFAGLGFIVIGLLNADWLEKTSSNVPILGSLTAQLSTISLLPIDFGIHPNQTAGTITLVRPLLVALLINSFREGNGKLSALRWFLFLASLFCGLALILTQSRSGWLGVLGGFITLLVLWGLTTKTSKERRALWFITGLVLIALLLILIGLGPQRIQQFWLATPTETAVGSLSTLNFRQDLWPWAIEGIKDFPFTGMGLGSFREAARRLYPVLIDPAYDFAHAHNVLLQVALDVGIPGLIAYIALLLVAGTIGWQLIKRERAWRDTSAGLLASLVAFHIYGLTDALAMGSKSSVLLWGIFGLLAAMIRLR